MNEEHGDEGWLTDECSKDKKGKIRQKDISATGCEGDSGD